jgi:hypothetical protein
MARWLPRALVALAALVATEGGAQAAVKCEGALAGPPLPGTLSAAAIFLQDVAFTHRSGRGTIPLAEFLAGVSGVGGMDSQELAQHVPLELDRSADDAGRFRSSGMRALDLRGTFNASLAHVRIPKNIHGQYRVIGDGVQFVYAGTPIRSSYSVGSRRIELRDYRKVVVMPSALFLYNQPHAETNRWDACYTFSN